MQKMDKSVQMLSDIIVHMKYAKYIPELQRRETWEEICERNMNMHIKKFPQLEGEIKQIYKNFVLTKKILPSMRSLQFSGKPIDVNPSRIYNCAYLPIDCVESFSETMFLLLGGTGVGFSVQRPHIEKLPILQGVIKPEGRQRKKRFLIGDSIEGWSDSIKALMESYFFGKKELDFDFRDIRHKGARLITSGGKAPGPEPLRKCIVNITNILETALQERGRGTKLKPIEVHDIICYIADAVLAGGIRRASLLSLFSKDDQEMLFCKTGTWWEKNPQRGRSNNSACFVRGIAKKEDFLNFWEIIKASGSGEPGVYWTNDTNWGVNPCCEIALRPTQCCVSGDTKLITKDGIEIIKDAVGKNIEIWNGKNWSMVCPFKTGDADKLYRVHFSDGSHLDATSNHNFLIKNRFQKDFQKINTTELQQLLLTSKYGLQVPRSNIVNEENAINDDDAYNYGFFLGDGNLTKEIARCDLYGKKNRHFNNSKVIYHSKNINNTPFTRIRFCFDVKKARRIKHDKGLPEFLFTWNKRSILDFFAGWADSDGCQASKGIRIYGEREKIVDGQLLLSKIGINSSVNLMSKRGEVTNFGMRNHDIWYLQITKTHEIPCLRLICNNTSNGKNKGKYQIVKKIEELDGLHESFCLTEKDLHQCVFNNVLTMQCNLTEINATNIHSQKDLNERAKAASFIATLQASYTDFHYLRDCWRENCEKDALLGVSMTGIGSGAVLQFDLTEAASFVNQENARLAKVININSAARQTCLKPGGTTSATLGCSSGIHAWHAPFYLRRVRVMKNEAIYRYMINTNPQLVEDEYFSPHDTAVISIPQKSPPESILRQESALSTLDRVSKFSKEWVAPGHFDGPNQHNVSCTVSIKKDEWDEVGEWMWENRFIYNGIAVLPYDGGTYKQAPFEDITEKQYNDMVSKMKPIDLSQVIEYDDNTNLAGEVACAGGACEVVSSY